MQNQQEEELIAAFRRMSALNREMLLNGAMALARKEPRKKPCLALVSGGGVISNCTDFFSVNRHLQNK